MTTDITELAQRNELLIANGQQTADLLRHLADNEIDSDYFAVVSECESYGKETDAELSITEFALRAAGYVDALVEALEKAQCANEYLREQSAEWERKAISNFEDCAEMSARIEELESQRKLAFTASNRWADKFREAEQRIAELEEAEQKLCAANVTLDARAEQAERRIVELPDDAEHDIMAPVAAYLSEKFKWDGSAVRWDGRNEYDVLADRVKYALRMVIRRAAGIKVEGE
ncbi:hypothetical protein DET57_114134 [Klebsiella oxytoca]|uniref:Ead/Ea22-like family protein n=1 Tax=Klebsiella oxytoca TaxID=571 RepID=A0A318FK65_KLEOX|nr:hypothetical protein [Klebsiella oxytoca]PXW42142.1 hypothetical protein DET57_114134 [Klebsiella oxytoca]